MLSDFEVMLHICGYLRNPINSSCETVQGYCKMHICTNSKVIKIFSKSYIWQCFICCWVCGSRVRALLNPTVLLGTSCFGREALNKLQ